MKLNIVILAAGAAGMICGSCLRDNALAGALLAQGHDVTMVPLYTPVRTDVPTHTNTPIFFGGINIYLEHASPLFRRLPRFISWFLDRPSLLRIAGTLGAGKPPAELVGLTRDVLLGQHGPTQREVERLLAFLCDVKPQIVTLPNLMFVGVAETIHRKTGAKVICELTGEDIFLDAMPADGAREIQELIRRNVPHVDAFVATSRYYARKMAGYLGIDEMAVATVYPGLPPAMLEGAPLRPPFERSLSVGYLARICTEKGIDQLAAAYLQLRQRPAFKKLQLCYAGYAGPQGKPLVKQLESLLAGTDAEYRGEVDLQGKLALLDSVRLFCVPTAYAEAKGIFALEALARGTPVVAPSHGSFVELAELTGSIALTPPQDVAALSDQLAMLLEDQQQLMALSAKANAAIRERFTADHMAKGMVDIFKRAIEGSRSLASGLR